MAEADQHVLTISRYIVSSNNFDPAVVDFFLRLLHAKTNCLL